MEPITTLKGYFISGLLHEIRILLLVTASVSFISHAVVAGNKPNKTPSTEDGGDGRGYLKSEYPPEQTKSSIPLLKQTYSSTPEEKTYSSSQYSNEFAAKYSHSRQTFNRRRHARIVLA